MSSVIPLNLSISISTEYAISGLLAIWLQTISLIGGAGGGVYNVFLVFLPCDDLGGVPIFAPRFRGGVGRRAFGSCPVFAMESIGRGVSGS
jgi:hypothetical protein